MKIFPVALLVSAISSVVAVAESDLVAQQVQVYPKNLARQHLGSNLFVFSAVNQTYVPTEAAAAWMDDDISTGWPAMAGKQHYLVALSEPELISNFSISARPASGTITLYSGDEPAAPGSKSWSPLATEVPVDSVNEKKLARPFSRFAKYILIETDIADPGPLYSLYLYGEKPAVIYNLRPREQAIDSRAVFGQYVNQQTNFNLSGLYAQSRVAFANSPEGALAWQKAIDDNPESGLSVMGSTNESGAILRMGGAHGISRIALLAEGTPKGKLEFFALDTAVASAGEGEVTPVSNQSSSTTGASSATPVPVSLEGMTPFISIILDGSNNRTSIDFPEVQAERVAMRWSPVTPTDTLMIREINSFDALSLNDYEVGLKPEAVAAYAGAGGKDLKAIAEGGPDFKDPKGDFKEPIAEGYDVARPLQGAIGFAPIVDSSTIPVSN